MRLYLAVAVLMLAFVAYTEAQDETVEQRLANFGQNMAEMGKDLAEKAKTAFDQIKTSDAAVKTQNWFQRQFDSVREHFQSSDQ